MEHKEYEEELRKQAQPGKVAHWRKKMMEIMTRKRLQYTKKDRKAMDWFGLKEQDGEWCCTLGIRCLIRILKVPSQKAMQLSLTQEENKAGGGERVQWLATGIKLRATQYVMCRSNTQVLTLAFAQVIGPNASEKRRLEQSIT